MSRGQGYALLAVCADVLIVAGSWHNLNGLTVLAIIGVNVLLLLWFAIPGLRAASQHQKQMLALPADDEAVAARERFIADILNGGAQ